MTIYNQPDPQAFAENAPSSEIATFTAWLRGLGIAFDETNGYPQMEGINDVFNRITQGIKYLEQYGIPLWRSDLEYPVGASVVYNGIQYRCITQNTNAQPDLSQNSWQSAIVDNLTTASTTQALSANQGVSLNGKIGTLSAQSSNLSNRVDNLSTQSSSLSNRMDNLFTNISIGYYSGYIYLGSLMLQWGTADFNSNPGETQVDITFQKPFNNMCLHIQATRKMSQQSSNGDGGVNIISSTKSGATFSLQTYNNSNSSDVRGFTWFAIGN